MSRAMSKVLLAAAVVGLTSVAALAQQSTTSETKTFEVIAVQGNQLVVSLPEGTRELTVADDFRFTVNGQQLAVRDLRPGMKGTATITTRTTVTPVTVTEVKNGTVAYAAGSTIIVRTDEGIRSFTQSEVDKRGVKIMRSGKPAQVSDFRQGDRLSATIITAMPPKVVTEQEVQATLATAASSPRRRKCARRKCARRKCARPRSVRDGAGNGRRRCRFRGCSGQNTAQDRQPTAVVRARHRVGSFDGTRADDPPSLGPLGAYVVTVRARGATPSAAVGLLRHSIDVMACHEGAFGLP